jgi:hypothetical protein
VNVSATQAERHNPAVLGRGAQRLDTVIPYDQVRMVPGRSDTLVAASRMARGQMPHSRNRGLQHPYGRGLGRLDGPGQQHGQHEHDHSRVDRV